MAEVKLAAVVRKEAGKSAAAGLRAQGLVPAVVYGAGKTNLNVAVAVKELERLFASGHATGLIRLEVGGGQRAVATPVLIKEVQREPVTHAIQHVDLHAVALDQAVTAAVPIIVHGEEKRRGLGGVVQHVLHTLEVSALPTDLPEHVEVDVSTLPVGHSLHVKDLALPKGVKAHTDPDDVVVTIVAPTRERVEGEAEAETEAEKEAAEPEATPKGKEKGEE
ncbi:MAG: 50S ribosomal protein L25 [Chitinophagales bacterium]